MKRMLVGGLRTCFVTTLLCLAFNVNAEVVVVTDQLNAIDKLTKQQVQDLYLGREKFLPGGQAVALVDLPPGNAVRDDFYQKIAGKNAHQVRAHWAKLIFTGKGVPPHSMASEDIVIQWVTAAPGRVGYVDSGSVSDKVKVLLRIP